MNLAASDRKSFPQWPLLIIAVFVLAYLLAGYLTLDSTGRRVPMISAIVTLILVISEWLRSRLRPGDHTDEQPEGGGVRAGASASREVLAIAFVAAAVVAIYFLGFRVAIPLYLFSSIAYLGKQSLRTALIVSAISSLTIYTVFELILSYRLYPGVFFS